MSCPITSDDIQGKDKLIKLGELAFKTQRNTLQNFDDITVINENYSIENNYPYLSSVKDIRTIEVNLATLPKSIKKNTKKTIKFIVPDIISNLFVSERLFFIGGGKFVVSDTFFVALLRAEYDKELVLAQLNSTLSLFATEMLGRRNLGGGLLTIYGSEFKSIFSVQSKSFTENNVKSILKIFDLMKQREIESIIVECGIDPKLDTPISEQEPNPLPDRAELDNVVFDALDLTEAERKEVYRAVCQLVWNRLSKAKSV